MRNNLGQSTLELTTTYAWALVIIAVFIGALIFYSSLDDQETSRNEECRLGPQFQCTEAYVDQYGHLNIQYLNNIRDEVIIKEIIFKNAEGNCPALPKNVVPSEKGMIQCYLDNEYHAGDIAEIDFEIIFSDKENQASFSSQSSVTTKVTVGNVEFDLDCDNDGDAYDIIGCGASNDCNDSNPNQHGNVACFIDEECADISYVRRDNNIEIVSSCNNEGTCNAKCVNPLDNDNDGIPSYILAVGGSDCDDNDPSRSQMPECGDYNPCPASSQCLYPGSCKARCFAINDDSGGEGLPIP